MGGAALERIQKKIMYRSNAYLRVAHNRKHTTLQQEGDKYHRHRHISSNGGALF